MTADDEAREALERMRDLFRQTADAITALGETVSMTMQIFREVAAALGHPEQCSMPCPACDEQLAEFEENLRNNEEGQP